MTSSDPSGADPTLAAADTLVGSDGSATRLPLQAPTRGTTLGRYVILRQLGAGGMGAVYEAFDPELERKVALKLMHRERGSKGALSRGSARMLREARAMAKLVHPNVITIFDVGTVEGQVFLAMELIDGAPLSTWMREPQRSLREIVEVFGAAGHGLAAAHRAGIVHRDFKPDNVLVGTDGRVVVLDFGIAAPSGAGSTPASTPGADISDGGAGDEAPDELVSNRWTSELTATGTIMGTPAYMAPEQHAGREIGARADQFAFCVSLYEALCGQRPFAGTSLPMLAAQVIEGKIRPIPADARMPRWMRHVVLRGLQPDPDARWPDMDALLADLSRRPFRRRRRVALVAALGVLVAGGLGASWLKEQRRVAACRDNEGELAGVWDAPQRERVQAALQGLGEPFARRFERIDEALGDYREQWLAVDGSVCVDRHPHAAVEQLCLDEARAHVAALSGLLDGELSSELVDGLATLGSFLPDLDECEAREELLRRFPLPPPGLARDAVALVRIDLARSEALLHANAIDEAFVISEDALARAREIAYEPLIAEALMRHAGAQGEKGDLSAAEATYWAAVAAAQRASHQRVAAESWSHLVYLVGAEQARPEEALRWMPVAQAAVQASSSWSIEAVYEGNAGAVYFRLQRWDEAKEHFEAALRRVEERRGPTSLPVVNYLNNLGAVEGARGDLQAALPYLERALAIQEEALGSEHADVARVIHNLGVTYAELGEMERAVELFQRALDIREQALPADHRDVAASLHGLGAAYYQAERYEEALAVGERAMGIQRRIYGENHPVFLSTQLNVVLALGWLERYEEARTQARRLVAARRALHEGDQPDLCHAIETLGLILTWSGQFEEALAVTREALAMRRALGASADIVAGRQRELADVYVGLHDVARARAELQSALELAGLSSEVADLVREDLAALDRPRARPAAP